MSEHVQYRLEDSIASITMDDGKVNALSLQTLKALEGALDQARADGAIIVLSGREGMFSAGFDLGQLRAGGPDAAAMLVKGFEVAEKMLSHPAPVVVACSGHAIAMAAFLVLSGDYRIGVDGPYRIVANEVAIGLTIPRAAVEICRQRLAPAHFNRAVLLSETYSPTDAVVAGFLDRTVQAAELRDAARTTAAQLGALNMDAHAASKQRLRDGTLKALRAAIEADEADFLTMMANPAAATG